MDKIEIDGGIPLHGTIKISGAKNSALKVMAASLLSDKPLHLKNVPQLVDIQSMIDLFTHHGVEFHREKDELTLNANHIHDLTAPYELVRKMRTSTLVMGPLLARYGDVKASLPGGCSIGARPIDLHLMGFEKMGAHVQLEDGYIHLKAPHGLKGNIIEFPFVSVGATENVMMAACLADGKTVLINAAQEPEIIDLADCLRSMGAKINGDGTSIIEIEGVTSLNKATHKVLPDRIEMGTYMVAALITNGVLEITNADLRLVPTFNDALIKSGALIEVIDNGIRIQRNNKSDPLMPVDLVSPIIPVDITTHPFPGFATDLQAQFMALMTLSNGTSKITETIFENRFMHVPELCRLGANITVDGRSAFVKGVHELHGAPVMASDLRASVSLILAGLVAHGKTTVHRIYHLDRGYEELDKKLSQCGAIIRRSPE